MNKGNEITNTTVYNPVMINSQNSIKGLQALRWFIVLATISSGLMAGATVDRFIVQFPAYRHIGVLEWARYSVHADLNNGIFLYPTEAISAFLLLILAALTIHFNKPHLDGARTPVYSAFFFALCGLVFTFFAAPKMLSLPMLGKDVSLLQDAFDKFYFWSSFRGVAQILVFLCSVWGMMRVFSIVPTSANPPATFVRNFEN